ncbi:MAG: pilus assembly protein [Gemmataceae bacterium]|nr:pilus assembly protein [Gemmataceae bacterium]
MRRSHHPRDQRRYRRGTAAIEFAILLPFLAFVFVLGVDWCRIYYAAHTLDDCARSGALAASGLAFQERGLSDSGRETRGKAEAIKDGTNLNPPLQESAVTVTTQGNYVTVTINYDFQTITLPSVIGGTWTLSRTVRMPISP